MPSRPDRTQPNHEALRLELARLRAERGLSFDALAEQTGVSRTALINIERGTSYGSLNTWFRLAHVLQVPLGSLVDQLDEPTTPRRSTRRRTPRA